MARAGRRPGRSGTREAILAAARRSFAARGYDATTIRGVAGAAGVDPALVTHYFGAKDGLFAAALDMPRAPSEALDEALEGERRSWDGGSSRPSCPCGTRRRTAR